MLLYKWQYTDKTLTLRKCMFMRASEASELRTFLAFSHSKTAISFNISCWYFKYGLRNIFNFRCQITSMQFPFITYGMVRAIYINDSIPTNTNIEQMYVYANELRKCWHFYILKLLFLSIFSRYKWHACRLTCTDKFPNIPTNTNIEQMYVYASERA